LSCDFMIYVLDSMIAVIEPEMPRQIATWGGTYATWQSNVTDLRDFILARCDSMNSGFVDCDTAITGIFDVTVEIIGIGEVEMSNSNIINDLNSGWTDQRFGGIDLPFEVVSGPFDHWEIISANTYIFDPNVDTLVLDLQGDVIVQAYFIPPTPTRDITYNIIPSGTATNITVDGVLINTFPTTINYIINEIVNISANLDPLYGFSTWDSDSVILTPTVTSPVISFSASNNDTVTLYLYKKPTIIYDVFPTGTTTTIDIDGINTSIFPTSAIYYNNENITLTPNIDPLYSFVSWDYDSITMLNGNAEVNSFVSAYNDTVKLVISLIPPLAAFISGDEVVCDNSLAQANIEVSFAAGFPPYTFIYAIDGITESSITTNDNPYYIKPKQSGVYTLTYFSDANNSGSINGSAVVTVLESPTAIFATTSDTLSVLYPSVQLNDISTGNIVAWTWDFGDNTPNDFTASPYHVFKDSVGIYQLSLIVTDDVGCSDTTFKQLWVADDYWMYIPNSFTPDYDGINDLFCLTHHGIREATFYFNVYDRFSNLVYATENIADLECFLNENGWDGKHYKTGNDLPMGTYIYEVYFQDFEGWKHQDMGNLFIIR
jgi:gliding motility-associated-like protein